MIRMSLDKGTVLPREVPPQRIGKKRYSMGAAFRGPAKRRRRANSDGQSEPLLPTHFLLGGNICDPLNLNSLLDEDINRATNQETPQCSPLPSRGGDPVEILVPRDITDPLNLKGEGGDGAEAGGVLLSPLKSRRRHRNRQHGGGEKEAPPTVPPAAREGSVPVSPLPCELNTAITCREDLAPPPVLHRRHTHPPPGQAPKACNPGDGRQRRRRRAASAKPAAATAAASRFHTPLVGSARAARDGGPVPGAARPPLKKDKHRYQYGNHSRYYGYHGSYGNGWEGRIGADEDPRLRLLEADWFRGKRVLDVGCGAGHVTLAVARRFNPVHILGVELDPRLVHAAKQNLRHFLSHDLVEQERRRRSDDLSSRREEVEEEEAKVEENLQRALRLLSFPSSLLSTRGPLSAPPLLLPPPPSSHRFPENVTFIQGDYVSEQEAWPGRGQYDVIMCLGVTKWVQLQRGDAGVLRLFRRAYHSLAPGGLFLLEPQPWRRYSHSKRASETTHRNYRRVRLKPEQFTCCLTDSVGFSSYRLLTHTHTGKQRPVYLFHKGPASRK